MNRPDKPLDLYSDAELPPLPPGADAVDVDAPRAARRAVEIARLRFLDPARTVATVTLRFPFALEDGTEVRIVTVRRLAVVEVGAIIEAYADDEPFDLYDFLAAMTGLPTPVLRGLDYDDGREVTLRARPLLPRVVDQALFANPLPETATSTAPGNGVASPSPPPGS